MTIPSDPAYVRVYVAGYPASNLHKFTPKQEATMLAILHVPSANWLTGLVVWIAIGHGVLMLQMMTLMSLRERVWPYETSLAI